MKPENMLTLFGRNVKRLRLQAGLSHEALAQRTTRFGKLLDTIEDGSAHVTLDMVIALALALDVEPSALLMENQEG